MRPQPSNAKGLLEAPRSRERGLDLFFLRASRRGQPAHALIPDSCCLKLLSWWYFIMAAPDTCILVCLSAALFSHL